MGSEFKRLRRFNGLWTTIRALTFAATAFMLLEGIFLLLGKMQILQLGLLGAVISLAAAAVVGALAFLRAENAGAGTDHGGLSGR